MSETNNESPEVTEWFDELDHPLKEAMMRVREIVLGADARMEESIKWSAPTFAYEGNLASFQPRAKKFVSLMFHRAQRFLADMLFWRGMLRWSGSHDLQILRT